MNKIAIILTDITKTAGTERAVCNLADILCGKYKVFIISTDSHCGTAPYPVSDKIEIIHLGLNISRHVNPLKKIHEYSVLLKKVKSICTQNDINFVIGTYSLINSLLYFLPSGIKSIGCEHFNYESSGRIQRIIRRLFYPKLSSVVLLTERDRRNYDFCRNTTVIPNSFSFDVQETSSCMNKEIISVGRLTYQKGYDILIGIAGKLRERIHGWHITIYGEGEDKENLESRINEYGLNDFISIHKYISNIKSAYLESSIYISTSRFEGLPMVLIEAQSCGLPAVSFDCPCGPSDVIIDGVTGYLVPMNDSDAFISRIAELCLSDEKRKEFGKNASTKSVRFSTESVAAKWFDLLEKL